MSETQKLDLECLALKKKVAYLQCIQLMIYIPLGLVLLALIIIKWDKVLAALG
ncbi:hypothetical protein [Shewanella sp. UCD-KL21]|uniref:hypothetical protein n=1 Tax=Shewanella sp. UCD-KL21 TaxID=1917164 RepID=UPI0015894F1D|nr:hypothetical protein [Shewanella sp. UCD-KL21]